MSSLLGGVSEDAMRIFKSTREYLTPVLTESAFLEKGMLTPEEFVKAGDHLIKTSPSWGWESGEKAKLKPYLPPNKQYLITRGVPCYQRIAALEEVDSSFVEGNLFSLPSDLKGEDDEDYEKTDGREDSKPVDEWFYTQKSTVSSSLPSSSSSAAAPPVVKEDEYLDMEDESLALDEVTTLPTTRSNPGEKSEGAGGGKTIRVRRYDVSITYDNYYRTPRIWLYGYDEKDGSPLEPIAIFEDVMTDYAKRTVTIDSHPHLSKPHGKTPLPLPFLFLFSFFFLFIIFLPFSLCLLASIHPCRHGPAMAKIVAALMESGTTPNVEQYLPIFLKFIQSVVPTIEYDYTSNATVHHIEK
jgi:ubiquitin-like-conjugating enzyme ATG3